MFFVKQGLSRVDVAFEKDAYEFGDIARAQCEIDNTKCEKDIQKVKFKLRRMIHCVTKDKRTFKENITLAKVERPGVKAGSSGIVNIEVALVYEKDLENFNKILAKNAEKFPPVPELEYLK